MIHELNRYIPFLPPHRRSASEPSRIRYRIWEPSDPEPESCGCDHYLPVLLDLRKGVRDGQHGGTPLFCFALLSTLLISITKAVCLFSRQT